MASACGNDGYDGCDGRRNSKQVPPAGPSMQSSGAAWTWLKRTQGERLVNIFFGGDCSLQFKQSMTMFANIMSTYVNICEDQQRRSIQCYTVHAMLNRYSQYSLYKATNACVVVGTGWSMPWHNVWARPLCLCSRWNLKSIFKRMFNVFSFPFTNTLIEVPRCNAVCADNGNELCSALKPRGGAWHGIYFKLESCKAIQLCFNVKVSPLAGPRKSLW